MSYFPLIRLPSCYRTYMLFAGWEVRIVKNCDRGLENAARGRGHSFSLYGPTLSRQITYLFFSCDKIGLQV